VTNSLGHGILLTNSFDTFSQNNYMVEAEDFDYNGGQFISPWMPDAYATLGAVTNIDFQHSPFIGQAFNYRSDGIPEDKTADFLRQAFVDVLGSDYGSGAIFLACEFWQRPAAKLAAGASGSHFPSQDRTGKVLQFGIEVPTTGIHGNGGGQTCLPCPPSLLPRYQEGFQFGGGFAAEAGYFRDPFNGGQPNALDGAKFFEERHFAPIAEVGKLVEDAFGNLTKPQFGVVRIREAVRFVTHALKQFQGTAFVRQAQGLFFAGQVDFLKFFRQSDDREMS
jgi:hypothetical protein